MKIKIKEFVSLSDVLAVLYFCGMIPLVVYIYINYRPFFFLALIVLMPLTIFFYIPIPGLTIKKVAAERYVEIYGDKEQLEIIAPELVAFYGDYVKINGGCARVLYPSEYPPQAFPGWLANYTALGYRLGITQHITQMDRTLAVQTLNKIILKKHASLTAMAQGHPARPAIELSVASDEALRDKLLSRQAEIFKTGIYFTLYADSKKELDQLTTEFAKHVRGEGLPLAVPTIRTEEAFYTISPRNFNMLKKWREMDTAALATTFFYVRNIFGTKTGVLFGFSPLTHQPILIDRFAAPSTHTIICGFTGAGKSFAVKVIIIYRTKLYYPDIAMLIIDPTGEYEAITELLDGEVIKIGRPEGVINPFDIKTVTGKRAPLLEKIQELITFFDMLYKLEPQEKAILSQVLPAVYERKGINAATNPELFTGESPTFSDLAEELKNYKARKDVTQEHKVFASNLQLYVEGWISGALRIFNQQTNVRITKDIVSLDISELSDMKEIFEPVMYLVMSYIDARVKAKPEQKKLVIIDEAHRLCGNDSTRLFMLRMVKEYRKFNTGAVLISQSSEDFLKYEEGEEILRMAYFNMMMWHKEIGEKTQNFYNFTQPEREIILTAQTGKRTPYSEALFISGTARAPMRIYAFEHEYPYATTHPEEVAKLKAEGVI